MAQMSSSMAAQTPPGEPDRSALEQLVRAHQTAIWRYLRFLGCDVATADDLTQDTFLAVAGRALHRFGPDAARAYLRRVARNAFLKSRRHAAISTTDLDAAELAYDWFSRDDEGERVTDALRRCLETLSPNARQALELRYTTNADRRELAAGLGLSSHGIKSLLQRSYARLRVCIERRLRDA